MKKSLLFFLILSTILYCKEKDIEKETTLNTNPTPEVERKKDPKEIIQHLKKNFFDPNEDILFQLNYEDFPEISRSKLKSWGIFRAEGGFSLHAFDNQSQTEIAVTQNSGTKFRLNFDADRNNQTNLVIRGETLIVGPLKKTRCIEFTKEYTDCKLYFDNTVEHEGNIYPYESVDTNEVIVRCRNDVVCFVSVPQEREYFPAFLWTAPAKSPELNDSFRRAYREYRKDPTAPPPSEYGFDEEKMRAWEVDPVEGE